MLYIVVIPEKEEVKLPDWLVQELELEYAFLSWWSKEKFGLDTEFGPLPSADYMVLLSSGYLDHPNNTILESGWFDNRFRIAYAKISNVSWFNRMKKLWLKHEWYFWQPSAGYNLTHELRHLLLWHKQDPNYATEPYGLREWFNPDYKYLGEGYPAPKGWRYCAQKL